jgi:hypothetical protein
VTSPPWTLVKKQPDPPGGPYQVTMSDTGRTTTLPRHKCEISPESEPGGVRGKAMIYTEGRREYVACPWCDKVWWRVRS